MGHYFLKAIQFLNYIKINLYIIQMLFHTLLLFCFLSTLYANEYKAVDELDLNKYVGKWYQVYQDNFNMLFQEGRCSTATYDFAKDNKVSVFNKQINNNNEYDTIMDTHIIKMMIVVVI